MQSTPPSTELQPVGQLRPCPFDAGKRFRVTRTARFDGEYVSEDETPDFYAYNVRCLTCAAEGPWKKSQSGAEQMWNGIPGTERGGPLEPDTDTKYDTVVSVLSSYLTLPHAVVTAIAQEVCIATGLSE